MCFICKRYWQLTAKNAFQYWSREYLWRAGQRDFLAADHKSMPAKNCLRNNLLSLLTNLFVSTLSIKVKVLRMCLGCKLYIQELLWSFYHSVTFILDFEFQPQDRKEAAEKTRD